MKFKTYDRKQLLLVLIPIFYCNNDFLVDFLSYNLFLKLSTSILIKCINKYLINIKT
ncbi:hypothetical protein C1646_725076 [Rhizophagus diaphanus]|nr:hypothetical protein C1646_725076 [Rhizophagus diaphanus] [Rhizophagus sp. MUCL 43196]